MTIGHHQILSIVGIPPIIQTRTDYILDENDYNYYNYCALFNTLIENDYNIPVEDDYKDTSDKNKIILPPAKVKKTVSVEMKIGKQLNV